MRVFIERLLRAGHFETTVSFGPFNSSTQRRWRKRPTPTAQTRLQDQRTRDAHFDKLSSDLRNLTAVLKLHHLVSTRKRGQFASVQIMSRWRALAGLTVGIGKFLRRHRRHVFDVFPHPVRRSPCCRVSGAMLGLLGEEERVVRESEPAAAERVRRLLMMSVSGSLRVHALRLVRRELGLAEDFRDSVLAKRQDLFHLVDLEVVELVPGGGGGLSGAGPMEEAVEQWRRREYETKWLSEFETKFAFPLNFPTGFRKESGFREKLRNWQRLPYLKPYERNNTTTDNNNSNSSNNKVIKVRSCGGVERYEKRVVGLLHEFLSLTVEKMVEVERLAHFRRDFAAEVNVRELILKHPGIFYLSTRGGCQRVFLREAYSRGRLVESNPIYDVRRKMLDLVSMRCRYPGLSPTSVENQNVGPVSLNGEGIDDSGSSLTNNQVERETKSYQVLCFELRS